jgi:hypothetical protein
MTDSVYEAKFQREIQQEFQLPQVLASGHVDLVQPSTTAVASQPRQAVMVDRPTRLMTYWMVQISLAASLPIRSASLPVIVSVSVLLLDQLAEHIACNCWPVLSRPEAAAQGKSAMGVGRARLGPFGCSGPAQASQQDLGLSQPWTMPTVVQRQESCSSDHLMALR